MGLSIGQIEKVTGGDEQMVRRSTLAIGSLKKQGIEPADMTCEFVMTLDVSASMDAAYRSGWVEKMALRALAFAAPLDNDATVQVIGFGRGVHLLDPINLNNYQDYFRGGRRFGRRSGQWWPELEGYTYLGKGMQKALEVVAEQLDNPAIANLAHRPNPAGCSSKKIAFVIDLTDGQPHDGDVAFQAQRNSADAATFWSHLYCGTGNAGWDFLQKLDNLPGRRVDNSNSARFSDLDRVTDADFYEAVTADFGDWARYVQDPKNNLLLPA